MKKIILAIIAIVAIAAIGVGVYIGIKANMKDDTVKYYDESFIEDFKSGLITRWQDLKNASAEEQNKEFGEKLVNDELDKLSKYKDMEFKDENLKTRAIAYINVLEKQKEAMSYFDTDQDKYAELYGESAKERATAVAAFIKDYSIEFPEKYAEDVKAATNPTEN